MSTSAFLNATRINFGLTAAVEKRLLLWIAQRTPRALTPDHFTALAPAAQFFAGLAYALSSHDCHALWVVNFFISVNWLGDILDGTLARVRNQQRPRYGFYVDQEADTFGAAALIGGLGCSGCVHWQVAVGMLVCFYILSMESYLATYSTGRFQLSSGAFGPKCQYCGHPFPALDIGGSVAITGMAVMAVAAATRHTVQLHREESVDSA